MNRNRKIKINYFIDFADTLKGSGIFSSAMRLKKGISSDKYHIAINDKKFSQIIHCHTALPMSFLKLNRIQKMKKKKRE